MAGENVLCTAMTSICKTCHKAPCSCKKVQELKPGVVTVEDFNPSFPEPPRNYPIVELQDSTTVVKGSSCMSFLCRTICFRKVQETDAAILKLEEVPDGHGCPEDSVVPKKSNAIWDFFCNMGCNPGKNIM